MITKELELKFLRNLEKYFEKIPQKEIDQRSGTITKSNKCGCFGAHIAKYFGNKWPFYSENSTSYFFVSGKSLFRERISHETEKIFAKYAWTLDESQSVVIGSIFSGIYWDSHPYEVIKKVIGELEDERSN